MPLKVLADYSSSMPVNVPGLYVAHLRWGLAATGAGAGVFLSSRSASTAFHSALDTGFKLVLDRVVMGMGVILSFRKPAYAIL